MQNYNYTIRIFNISDMAVELLKTLRRNTGLSREQLYRSFSEKGNPRVQAGLIDIKRIAVP